MTNITKEIDNDYLHVYTDDVVGQRHEHYVPALVDYMCGEIERQDDFWSQNHYATVSVVAAQDGSGIVFYVLARQQEGLVIMTIGMRESIMERVDEMTKAGATVFSMN